MPLVICCQVASVLWSHQFLRNFSPALPNHVLAVADETSPKTSSWVRLSFILSTDEEMTRRTGGGNGEGLFKRNGPDGEWQAGEKVDAVAE